MSSVIILIPVLFLSIALLYYMLKFAVKYLLPAIFVMFGLTLLTLGVRVMIYLLFE